MLALCRIDNQYVVSQVEFLIELPPAVVHFHVRVGGAFFGDLDELFVQRITLRAVDFAYGIGNFF